MSACTRPDGGPSQMTVSLQGEYLAWTCVVHAPGTLVFSSCLRTLCVPFNDSSLYLLAKGGLCYVYAGYRTTQL